MTIGGALNNLATAVDQGETAVNGASGAMAQAARDNDAGGVAAQIANLTSGMAVIKMAMTQQQVLSGVMVESAQTAGRSGS